MLNRQQSMKQEFVFLWIKCRLVTTNGWTGLYGVANYKKLFTIENGVPVVNNVGKDSPCYKQLCAEYKEFLKNEKEKEA